MWSKKKKIFFRKKIYKYFVPAVSSVVSLGLAVSFASCSPNQSIINNLLNTSNKNKFAADFDLLKVSSLSLADKNGYESYLYYKIGEILIKWYENNKNKDFVGKLANFKSQVDIEWANLIDVKKNTYGSNDYQLFLQTDELDKNCGTPERWKKIKLINLVINDFFDELFIKDYLWYYDSSAEYREKINSNLLNNPSNWTNLKFQSLNTDQYYDTGISSLFAVLQEEYFNSWVENMLPLLTSYIFFPHDNLPSGLSSIFDQSFFSGADLGGPSYNFQVFSDSKEAGYYTNSQKEYENIIVNKFSKYFDDTSHGVNFESWDSSKTESGKLVSLVDLFNSENITFASGIISLLNNKLGIKINIPISEADNNNKNDNHVDNIMKNFIFNDVNSIKPGTFRNKNIFVPDALSEKINDTSLIYYKDIYTKLFSNNGSIADIVKPNFTSYVDKFILIRNTSGVYILAIDGLDYFSNSNRFDINKLKLFLKYRSVQKSNHYVSLQDSANDVFFNILSSVHNYIETHKFNKFNVLLRILTNEDKIKLFANATNQIDSFISDANKILYETENSKIYFQNLQTLYEKLNFYFNCVSYIDTIRQKYLMRFKEYSNYISLSFNNHDAGMYSSLPFRLNYDNNQINLIPQIENLFSYSNDKFWWNNSNQSNPGILNYTDLKSSLKATESEIEKNSNNYVKNLNLGKLKNINNNYFQYSQSIFTNNIGIDISINSYFENSYADFKNIICSEKYFKEGLKDFYSADDVYGSISDSILDSAITSTYKLNSLMTSYENNVLPWKSNFSSNIIEYIKNEWKNIKPSKIDYFSFLYTVKYLLSPADPNTADKTPRLKKYLQDKIFSGKIGYQIWLSPTDQADTDFIAEDLFKSPNNPNYIFGDLDNNFEYSDINARNLKKDAFNKLKNPFRSAKFKYDPNDQEKKYGYLGLITDENFKNIPNAVLEKINKESLLYSFGNKQKLEEFINKLPTLTEIRIFANNLSKINNSADWVSIAFFNQDIKEVKNKFISEIEKIDNKFFEPKNGYLNKEKIEDNLQLLKKQTYISAVDDKELPGYYYGYVRMFNFVDANKIDSNWSKDPQSRMNMDLEAFIQIACDFAMNDLEIRNDAIAYLINSLNGRTQIYDSRITIGTDNIWFYIEKRGNV